MDADVARLWAGDRSAITDIIRKRSVGEAIPVFLESLGYTCIGSALHACAFHDFKAGIADLIAAGADANAVCPATSDAPLMVVCMKGHAKTAKALMRGGALVNTLNEVS